MKHSSIITCIAVLGLAGPAACSGGKAEEGQATPRKIVMVRALDMDDPPPIDEQPAPEQPEGVEAPSEVSDCESQQTAVIVADGVNGDGALHAWLCTGCGLSYDADGALDLTACAQDDAFLNVCSDVPSEDGSELCRVCVELDTGEETERTCHAAPPASEGETVPVPEAAPDEQPPAEGGMGG